MTKKYPESVFSDLGYFFVSYGLSYGLTLCAFETPLA